MTSHHLDWAGQGNAGSVEITANDTITIDGEDSNGFPSGATSLVNPGAVGDAGGVTITTGSLSLTNGGRVSASTLGQGNAGSVEITAESIELNEGRIEASTNSGEDGNIALEIADNLTLGQESIISAKATSNANGGNININGEFIIALPNQNNDIIAIGEQGDGGQINITAEGIFGIEERSSTPTNQTNDIDASSEFGLAGVVEINQPDLDPNRGLVELPETVVDPAALVAQNPCKRGSESEFVITGRGGLPPSLNEDLSSEATQVGLVEPAPIESRGAGEQENREAEDRTSSPPSVPTPIIPAQGWVFNDKGEVVLVAYDPTVTGPQRLRENEEGCTKP